MPVETYPICFALVTPKAGAHTELLYLLQGEIVGPLVEKQILHEFRVLSATPATFVAEDSTLLLFELLVPCPISITDWEVQQWQSRLGSDVCLVVLPSSVTPLSNDAWDSRRARSVLERVMRQGPARKPPRASAVPWLIACVDRSNVIDDQERGRSLEAAPTLFTTDEITGRRVQIPASMRATLMNDKIASDLCQHLPVSLRWRSAWRLVYSPRIHGVSLNTFYRRVQDEGPTMLLVQDHHGYVFGGFASAAWHIADRYFGDGECFVFKFKKRVPMPVVSLTRQQELSAGAGGGDVEEPVAIAAIQQALETIRDWQRKMAAKAEQAEREAAIAKDRITSPTEALDALDCTEGSQSPATSESASPVAAGAGLGDEVEAEANQVPVEDEDEEDVNGDKGLQVFHWSSQDPFFLFSDLECIGMGGGSAFALYLDKDLLHGVSEPCSTFASSRLSSTENFIIGDLEVWAFDDPSMEPLRPPKRF